MAGFRRVRGCSTTDINLGAAADVTAAIPVKEAGVYHLFVRSIGTPTSSFHVKIDGKEVRGHLWAGPAEVAAWRRLHAEERDHRCAADGD